MRPRSPTIARTESATASSASAKYVARRRAWLRSFARARSSSCDPLPPPSAGTAPATEGSLPGAGRGSVTISTSLLSLHEVLAVDACARVDGGVAQLLLEAKQ